MAIFQEQTRNFGDKSLSCWEVCSEAFVLRGSHNVSRCGGGSGGQVFFQAQIIAHCCDGYSKPQLSISFAKPETPPQTTGLRGTECCLQRSARETPLPAGRNTARQHQDSRGRVHPTGNDSWMTDNRQSIRSGFLTRCHWSLIGSDPHRMQGMTRC